MVKISKKPLRPQPQQNDDTDVGDIFASMARNNPAPEKPLAKETPDVAALMQQIGALETRLSQAEQARIAAYTVPAQPQAPQEPKAVAFDDLPDPITHPTEYGIELNKRITQSFEDRQRYEQQRQAETRKTENATEALWEDFQQKYENLAADEDKVEFVALKVAQRMQARGVDMQRYMHGDRQGFMQDIANEYERVFGKPEGDYAPAPADRKPPRRARSQVTEPEYDDEPNRTGGIFGGGESGGRPNPRNPAPGDMIKDLQDLQRKSGLF